MVRFKVIQSKYGKLDFPLRDFAKEERLRIVLDSFDFFEEDGYFEALEKVYMWQLEEDDQ